MNNYIHGLIHKRFASIILRCVLDIFNYDHGGIEQEAPNYAFKYGKESYEFYSM